MFYVLLTQGINVLDTDIRRNIWWFPTKYYPARTVFLNLIQFKYHSSKDRNIFRPYWISLCKTAITDFFWCAGLQWYSELHVNVETGRSYVGPASWHEDVGGEDVYLHLFLV